MIIFHEGLPGSGKSYESVVRHIIPTLQSGRSVYAYVEGLDYSRISEVSGIPIPRLEELLVVMSRDDVPVVYDVVPNNAFVVIDESQNFFPCGKQKQDDDLVAFVTEHRHRGIDILLMGQDIRDVNAIWRRRVDQKVLFTKMDMFGMSSRYRWILMKAMAGEKFEEVNRGISKYDPRYFGTYRSHVNDDVNKDMYRDKRSFLFGSNYFKLGIVLVSAFFIFGYYGYSSFFSTDRIKSRYPSPVSSSPVSYPSSSISKSSRDVAPKSDDKKSDDLVISYLNQGFRPRLGSVLLTHDRADVVVEFLDSSLRVQDRISSGVLSILGWRILIYGVQLAVITKPGNPPVYVTPWPLDSTGRVSENRIDQINSSDKSVKVTTKM